MTTNTGVLRVCDLCGGVDDHPRHVIIGTEQGQDIIAPPTDEIIAKVVEAAPQEHVGRLLRDLMDTTASDRHLDCCRTVGCPQPADDPNNCANKTKGAEDLRGADLVDHIIGGVR
jgi:hypothetical protein